MTQRRATVQPELRTAFSTCYFTASRLMPRPSAIARLDMPWRTVLTTRHSAGVSTSGWGGRPRARRVAARGAAGLAHRVNASVANRELPSPTNGRSASCRA